MSFVIQMTVYLQTPCVVFIQMTMYLQPPLFIQMTMYLQPPLFIQMTVYLQGPCLFLSKGQSLVFFFYQNESVFRAQCLFYPNDGVFADPL